VELSADGNTALLGGAGDTGLNVVVNNMNVPVPGPWWFPM
jgi:hypothetical protein